MCNEIQTHEYICSLLLSHRGSMGFGCVAENARYGNFAKLAKVLMAGFMGTVKAHVTIRAFGKGGG